MESEFTKQARQNLIAAVHALTPAPRLEASLAHCRLMMELRNAPPVLRSPADRERR